MSAGETRRICSAKVAARVVDSHDLSTAAALSSKAQKAQIATVEAAAQRRVVL
jgi:hypothetical protein